MKAKLFLVMMLMVVSVTACQSDNDTGLTTDQTNRSEEQSTNRTQPNPTSQQQALPTGTPMATFVAPLEPQTEIVGESEADMAVDDSIAGEPADAPLAPSPAPTQAAMPTTAPSTADMFFEDYGVNPFLDTEDDNLSTFAMDVDTASYTLTRNYLQGGVNQLPPEEAIRPEEFVNYFDAGYPLPEDETFGINLTATPAPFGYENHYLMRVGIQGQAIAPEDRPAALLIFVIDVSGSMDMENRLGLVKESLAILVEQLREDDRIAIVVYASQTRAILDPTPASEKDTILNAINALRPDGSTNVTAGLELGYSIAQDAMQEGDITRVIVLSDGVANVDLTTPEGILGRINDGIDAGVTLSTIGFGMGNYNDVMMEQLANQGNGNYYYIDNLRQARQIFVHNLTGTLQVIGYDAKIQVEFHTDVVDRYRLIGYENRAIADEDFRNDTVDAGEVGAGHSVTALYEIAFEDGDMPPADAIIATVYIRYEDAATGEVIEQEKPLTVADVLPDFTDATPEFQIQAIAAEFAELLRGSYWAEDGNYVDLLTIARPLLDAFPDDPYITELVDLIRLAGQYIDQG